VMTVCHDVLLSASEITATGPSLGKAHSVVGLPDYDVPVLSFCASFWMSQLIVMMMLL